MPKVAKKPTTKKAPEAVFSHAEKTKPSRPAKKAAPKKAAKKVSAKGRTAKKTTTKKVSTQKGGPGRALPRDYDEHGHIVGSDAQKIFGALLEGGPSRTEMNQIAMKAIGRETTPEGNKINMSSLIASLVKEAERKGYTVESSWKLLPPTPASKAAATRRAKKAEGAAKAPSKPAKKAPAKKAVKSKKRPPSKG